MISLPLLNSVGLFLEESEERDYLGLGSFVALSYILVPFQAYAAVKGFIEKEEGTWFRTPKTGRITDTFMRGKFYRFISGIIPGKQDNPLLEEKYLALLTANNMFNKFNIKPKNKWFGKVFLSILLIITVSTYSLTKGVPEALATNPATTQYLWNNTTATLTNAWTLASTVDTVDTTTVVSLVRNAAVNSNLLYDPGATNATAGTKCSSPTGNGWILDTPFEGSDGTIASGAWSFYIYESDTGVNRTAHLDVCIYKVSVSGGSISASTNLYDSDNDGSWPTTDIMNGGVTSATYTTSSQAQFNFTAGEYIYIEYWLHNTTKINEAAVTSTFYTGETGTSDPNVIMPTITIPENALLLLLVVPFIPMITLWLKKSRKGLVYA